MSLYSKARKHIDMNRVKELREEAVKEQKIAEVKEQQEETLAELKRIEIKEDPKYSNWRRDLENVDVIEEGMTTTDVFSNTLTPEGDVDIVNTDTTFDNLDSSISQTDNISRSGTTMTLQGTENQIVGGTQTYYNVARFQVDGTKVSHVKITISKGGGTSSWTDRDGASNFDDHVNLNITDADNFFAPGYNDSNLSSGTHIIAVPGNYKNLRISFEQFGKVGGTGPLRITNVSLQRRTPVNVFVSLDDPESTAFVRDGDFDRLSPADKKKKLEEQLAASKGYLDKMFGEGMPGTATKIADYQPQQSFVDNYHADKYGLPTDYKDKLGKAQAYFQNNLNKVGYRTLGFTEPERMDALYDKAFKKQGFTDKQIETIKKEKLLKVDYGRSPSLKAAEERAKRDAERAAAERQQQARSYAQPFTGLSPEDLKAISDRVGGSYSGRTGRGSTQKPYMNIRVGDKPTTSTSRSTYNSGKDYGQIAQGPRGFDRKPGTYHKNNIIPIKSPGSKWRDGEGFTMPELPSTPFTGPGLSRGRGNQIAANQGPSTPVKQYDGKFMPNPGGGRVKPGSVRPKGKAGMRLAHHEPEGEVIKEKKTFKDLTKKIPGYYDGKPSPLGFPVEEPPKTKNGYHPDLVDGKKVANRFNRLDPISARAMPKTGNPHIDKKVRAAAKKPK